jgi:hypothetical protein
MSGTAALHRSATMMRAPDDGSVVVNGIAIARPDASATPRLTGMTMRLSAMIAAAAALAIAGPACAGDGLDRHGLDHYRDGHWWGAFAEPPAEGQPPVAEFYAHYIPRGVLYNGPPPRVARARYHDVIRAKY